MAHLAQHSIIHRDLACRNVRVFGMHQTDQRQVAVKISDFGLVVHCVATLSIHDGLRGPVRWMAPEVIARSWNSSQSDVFAFGVTLWEMWEHGAAPWSVFSDMDVAMMVQSGERLERPDSCPDEVQCCDAVVLGGCPAEPPDVCPSG